jgi:hypothetical protein
VNGQDAVFESRDAFREIDARRGDVPTGMKPLAIEEP